MSNRKVGEQRIEQEVAEAAERRGEETVGCEEGRNGCQRLASDGNKFGLPSGRWIRELSVFFRVWITGDHLQRGESRGGFRPSWRALMRREGSAAAESVLAEVIF